MDMCVRNLKPYDYDCNFFHTPTLFNFSCDFLGKYHHVAKCPVIEIKYVINLLLRDNKGMPFLDWINIEKCVKTIVFRHSVVWYLA